jgi:hypothetical protein
MACPHQASPHCALDNQGRDWVVLAAKIHMEGGSKRRLRK